MEVISSISGKRPFHDAGSVNHIQELVVDRDMRPKLFEPENEDESLIRSLIGDASTGCLARNRDVRPTASDMLEMLSISGMV